MPWELSVAALTCGKTAINDDVVGVNGWALTGIRPAILTARHLITSQEAFVIADGIQPGYGGLGAQLVAREASVAASLADRPAVVTLLTRLHEELVAGDYFSRRWDVTPDRLRLPGTTVVGCRVDAANRAAGLLLFNVGDAGGFVIENGHLAKQSIDDRAESGMLTQCIGGGPPGVPKPHVVTLELSRFNRVLLCSDGLTDTLDYSAINQIVSSPSAPKVAVAGLVEAACAKKPPDDVSALVLDVAWAEPEPMAQARRWSSPRG
jgi:protein phosphatase